MTDWYELARRWTPRCRCCGEYLDDRMGTEECINEVCPEFMRDIYLESRSEEGETRNQ